MTNGPATIRDVLLEHVRRISEIACHCSTIDSLATTMTRLAAARALLDEQLRQAGLEVRA